MHDQLNFFVRKESDYQLSVEHISELGMVLTSAGAIMASFIGIGKKKKESSSAPQGAPSPASSSQSSEDNDARERRRQSSERSAETAATTSSIDSSIPSATMPVKLVMLMFWVGVMVGIIVSGLAAWRLYNVNMAERESQMVAEMLQQEARLEQEKQDRFWLGLAIASLISAMAVIQSYRMKMAEREACAKNQRRLKSLLVERMSRTESVPEPEEEGAASALHCVICLTAGREVILLDCGHVCACRQCADTLLREEHPCPVCRAEIRTVKPAFIS